MNKRPAYRLFELKRRVNTEKKIKQNSFCKLETYSSNFSLSPAHLILDAPSTIAYPVANYLIMTFATPK